MPFGEYENFDDCLSKNSDKDDPSAYCGYIKHQVEEALKQKEAREAINKATEQTPEQVASLTTPDAGNIETEEPKDLTAPQGSSKEAENDQASGDGETSPADPPQDEAEPEANPQDQAKPENVTTTEVSPDSEIKTNDKYGELNGDKYAKNEDELKDDKRDEHQGLEYNGETYNKVKAIEYDDEIYTQKDDKEEAEEDDLEYEDKYWEKADEDTLELDDDYYKKDNEQAPMDLSGSTATPALDVPEMNPVLGESVIIKENGRYKKYHVFQASEQEEPSVEQPAEVPDQPPVIEPQPEIAVKPEETKIEPVEQKASEDIKAVEKIIVKEDGKLKFKSVFREVKKKASRMTR
jgi:hypothetical protein